MTEGGRIKVLFLAASPGEMGRINAQEEARQIRDRLRAAGRRDAVDLIERYGVRPGDLQDLLFEFEPHIVHFSGHGTKDEEIVLEDERGSAAPVDKSVLAELFRLHRGKVRAVVLNACHSRPQGEAISEHIELAIGMKRAIGGQAAIAFSAAFYLAIAHGWPVRDAYDSAVLELRARGIPEDRTVQLVTRPGADAARVIPLAGAPPPEPRERAPSPAPPALEERVSGAPAPRPIPGENRVCTIMGVDLSTVAALASHLDPSEVTDLLDRCHRAAAEAVLPLGGHVEPRAGYGAVAVFGALRATEGDAERAVRAALRIQAALAKIRIPRAPRGSRLAARVGISTGRVFVQPSAERRGPSVTGDAVLAASALERAAAPGAILIDRDTAQWVAGRFNLERLAPGAGGGEQHIASRVKGPVPLQHGLSRRDFFGLDTALIGRGAERDRFAEALDVLARERRAACFTLVGAPGSGRSRLLAEIVSFLTTRRQVYILVAAQSSALAVGTSFGLASELLRARFNIPEGAPRAEILRRLRRGARWLRVRFAASAVHEDAAPLYDPLAAALDDAPTAQDLDDALVQIATLLDTRSDSPQGAASPDIDGAAAKNRIAAAVATLVRFAASLAPVILLCDDLQWADDASLDLLAELFVRVQDLPVLAVCAARPDFYERRPLWGEGKSAHRRVDLAPLERRHIEDMARDRLRLVSDLSPDFLRAVTDRADKSPLILDETLRLLVDAGVIEAPPDGGAWRVYERDLGALSLPATVQGIVQARLDCLDPPVRGLLARAAVVGKTFWDSAVEELRRVSDPLDPAQETTDVLASLRERQLVLARDTTTFPGERERVFAEAATHEVAYAALPVRVRRSLHLAAAAWLRERAPGSAHAALLALHHDRGGDVRGAIDAYSRAAAHASSLGQNAEARGHLLRACELLSELTDQSLDEDNPRLPWQDEARVRLELGDVLVRLGRFNEADAAYAAARAAIAATDPEAPRWEARADFRLALSYKVRGRTADARELLESAVARARGAGLADELPAMYAQLTFLYRRERKHADSRRTAIEALRACRPLRGGEQDGRRYRDSVTRALLGLAPVLYSLGRWISAERTYRQAARIAIASGDMDHLGRAWNGVASSLLARREHTAARAVFLEALRVKQKAGDLHQIAVAYVNLAELSNTTGDHAAALEHARRSARLAEQIHAESDLAEMYRNMAVALMGLGRIAEALEAGVRALKLAEEVAPVYLPGAVETLTAAFERAAASSPLGPELRARANETRQVLASMMNRSFIKPALAERLSRLQVLVKGSLT